MRIDSSGFLVKADRFCDYVPYLSTVSNIVDLFQKCIVLPFKNSSVGLSNRYYDHLKQKSILRCLVLLIPISGNIVIALYDFTGRYASKKPPVREEKFVPTAKRVVPIPMPNITPANYADRGIVRIAKRVVPIPMPNITPASYADREFVLKAVASDGFALRHAAPKLRKDPEVVRAAFRKDSHSLQYADRSLKENREFMLSLIKENWIAFQYASECLKKKGEFRREAVEKNQVLALSTGRLS